MAIRDINMLPLDVLEKSMQYRLFKFWAQWLVLVLVIVLACCAGSYRWIQLQKKALPLPLDTRQAVSQELDKINDFHSRIAALQEKHQTLARIVKKQVFYDTIAVFAGCLNHETWIDQLSIKRDDDESDQFLLTCNGFSLNHNTLGLFLDRIAKVPRIKEVELNKSGTGSQDTGLQPDYPQAVRFSISCVMTRMPLK
nr:hypothetical protein [uncultured Desulfobacter sp.]